ncbi:DUF951 domain-containing protein [bacterium]|jgi:hypothetical protein|nr:DUF951 domain-containing protein [bacterium]
MEKVLYDVEDIVELKKAHPCTSRSKQWRVLKVGVDIKIKCLGCGAIVVLPRFEFEKKIVKTIK